MSIFGVRKILLAAVILLLLNQILAHINIQKETKKIQQTHGHHHERVSGQSNLIRDKSHIQDKAHIKEHLQEMTLQTNLNELSDKELEFYYFKMHDNDGNNKLDGCELIKSVLHWHAEQNHMMGAQSHLVTSAMTDSELSMLVNPILDLDDTNHDGFIDYAEFVAAQTSRGF